MCNSNVLNVVTLSLLFPLTDYRNPKVQSHYFSKLCSEQQKYKEIATSLDLNIDKAIFYIRRTHFA